MKIFPDDVFTAVWHFGQRRCVDKAQRPAPEISLKKFENLEIWKCENGEWRMENVLRSVPEVRGRGSDRGVDKEKLPDIIRQFPGFPL